MMADSPSKVIGRNTRSERDDRGWSLEALVARLRKAEDLQRDGVNVTTQSLSRIERGEQNVSPAVAKALADVFGMSVDDLFTPDADREARKKELEQKKREREQEQRKRWLADEIEKLTEALGEIFELGREMRKAGDEHPAVLVPALFAGTAGVRVADESGIDPLLGSLLRSPDKRGVAYLVEEAARLGADLAAAETGALRAYDRDITPEQHAASERFNSREEQTRKDFGDAITEDEAEEAWEIERDREAERDRRRDARRSGGER